MSRRQLKTDDEEGFLRAFRDEVMDLAKEYDVRLEFTLRVLVLNRKLCIHGEAYYLDPFGAEQLFAMAEQEYPSHSVARLHAALYRAAIKLGGAIRQEIRFRASEGSPAPSDGSE